MRFGLPESTAALKRLFEDDHRDAEQNGVYSSVDLYGRTVRRGLEQVMRTFVTTAIITTSMAMPPCRRLRRIGVDAKANILKYCARHPQYSDKDRQEFLTAIRDRIVSGNHRPILVHCWNGNHASGAASAIALRQFCGVKRGRRGTYWKTTATLLSEGHREFACPHTPLPTDIDYASDYVVASDLSPAPVRLKLTAAAPLNELVKEYCRGYR